jgi:hypothetical protein
LTTFADFHGRSPQALAWSSQGMRLVRMM